MKTSDFSEIATAGDDNFVVHAAWLQRLTPGMTVREDDDVVVVDSGLACDTFNCVCRSQFVERAHFRVRQVLSYVAAFAHPFSWWLGPRDRPADLGRILQDEGLNPAESELAMTAPLMNLDLQQPRPNGLRIERVVTRQQLSDFAYVNAANWVPPDAQVTQFYEIVAAAALSGDSPFRFYVGYIGETPVATSELTASGTTVGLYNIATVAAHRRQGFGTAMTIWPLLEARREAFVRVVLQAAPDGVSIYRRLGFHTYGEITEYKPHADLRRS